MRCIWSARLFVINSPCRVLNSVKAPLSLREKLKYRNMVECSSGHEFQHLNSLFQDVSNKASENADYFFTKQKNQHSNFIKSFQTILNVLDPLHIAVEAVTSCCFRFDISSTCKGNGYRSIISIVEACLQKILLLSGQIQSSRDKLFFRSYHVYMELDSYTQVLTRLLTIVHLAIVLIDCSKPGCLFPSDENFDELMDDFEKVNRECFYGRSFGFQYADSIQQSLQVVAVATAAYGDGYTRHNHSFARALSSMLHSGKYVLDPELRAKRITELTQNENIEFCKAFWSLTEEYGIQHAPLLVCPAMAVNNEFVLPSKPLSIKTLNDDLISVELPVQTHGIKARLLSYVWREGQSQDLGSSSKPYSALGPKPSKKSRYLMFHCHGGGFVAQSSKSHEMYLRYWAKELKMPILSIDYSLAPDAPFPQALDEIYFAYVWALKNFDSLGTFGEKICFTGDSAGANLVTSLCLKAIESNIRLPDSLVVAYPPYRIQYIPSPSRLLSLMDPLLPVGVLKSCIQAYTGAYSSKKNKAQRLNSNFYSDEDYNAYDVEFQDTDKWFPYNQFHLNHKHSFSESKLNLLKEKISNANIAAVDDDTDTFYSDFPFSEDNNSVDSDRDMLNEIPDVFQFTASKLDEITNKQLTNHSTASVFSSLKQHMSTKMQDLASGVSSYLYTNTTTPKNDDCSDKKVENHSKTKINQATDSPVSSVISNSTSMMTRKRHFDSKQIQLSSDKDKFSICKSCLHKSCNCSCGIHFKSLKRLNEHYRSSQHHVTNNEHIAHNNRTATSYNRNDGFNTSYKERSKSDSSSVSDLHNDSSINSNKINLKSAKSCPINSVSNIHLEKESLSLNLNSTLAKPSDSHVTYSKDTDTCTVVTPKSDNSPKSDHSESHELQSDNVDNSNPYLSPYMAEEELLKKLPPIIILACSLDPLFDDSVEFIRKLHNLKHENAELYILDELPHGFLNFQMFSTEARSGCDLMVACVKKSLEMGIRRIDSSIVIDLNKTK